MYPAAAAGGGQSFAAGKLHVVWVPLSEQFAEPGEGTVLEIMDEKELIGKPWTFRVDVKQALSLPMVIRRCKLDPGLKATYFQPLNREIAYSAFNLNLVSELAPLHRGGGSDLLRVRVLRRWGRRRCKLTVCV